MATSIITIDLQVDDLQYDAVIVPLAAEGRSISKSTLLFYQYLDRWTVAPGLFHRLQLKDNLFPEVDVPDSMDDSPWKIEIDLSQKAAVDLALGRFVQFDHGHIDHLAYFFFVLRQCLLAARDLLQDGERTIKLIISGIVNGPSSVLPPGCYYVVEQE